MAGLQFWDWYDDGSVYVVDVGLACCTLEFEAAAARRSLIGRDPIGQEPIGQAGGGAEPAEVEALPPGARVLIVVSGTVTDRLAPTVVALIERVRRTAPQAKVVAFGACASAGGPYWDSYAVTKGIDQLVEVEAYVPGCPPPPDALDQVIAELAERTHA